MLTSWREITGNGFYVPLIVLFPLWDTHNVGPSCSGIKRDVWDSSPWSDMKDTKWWCRLGWFSLRLFHSLSLLFSEACRSDTKSVNRNEDRKGKVLVADLLVIPSPVWISDNVSRLFLMNSLGGGQWFTDDGLGAETQPGIYDRHITNPHWDQLINKSPLMQLVWRLWTLYSYFVLYYIYSSVKCIYAFIIFICVL